MAACAAPLGSIIQRSGDLNWNLSLSLARITQTEWDFQTTAKLFGSTEMSCAHPYHTRGRSFGWELAWNLENLEAVQWPLGVNFDGIQVLVVNGKYYLRHQEPQNRSLVLGKNTTVPITTLEIWRLGLGGVAVKMNAQSMGCSASISDSYLRCGHFS